MCFEELEDAAAPGGKVFESPDEYVKRLEGNMLLYGAVMQVGAWVEGSWGGPSWLLGAVAQSIH